MKKIKFNKNWLIGIVSGLLIVAILGTTATVFVKNGSDSKDSEEKLPSVSTSYGVVAGQPGLGQYVEAPGVLTYDYEKYTPYEINSTDWTDLDIEGELGFALASRPVMGGNTGNNANIVDNGSNRFLKIEKTETGMSRIYFPVVGDAVEGGCTYVFETDILWGGCAGFSDGAFDYSWAFRIELRSDKENNGVNPAFCSVYGTICSTGFDQTRVSLSGLYRNYVVDSVMTAGNWYNLRVEYTTGDGGSGHCEIYLDNILVNEFSVGEVDDGDFKYVAVELRTKTPETFMSFDNTYVSIISVE